MKKTFLVSILLGLAFSLNVFASNNNDFQEAVNLASQVQSALQNPISAADFEAIKYFVESESKPQLHNVSEKKVKRVVFCGAAKAALVAGASGTICFLANGQKFLLQGVNLGYQASAGVSLQAGLFVSKAGASMVGTYYGGTSELMMSVGATLSALVSTDKQIYIGGIAVGVFGGISGSVYKVVELNDKNEQKPISQKTDDCSI